ncbi:MAG: alanine racemase [Pseudomonadota bacterium]
MSLRPRARIHLKNIAENWQTLRHAQAEGITGAVVKADAYGHGISPVATALHDAGCDHFFVAHLFEAETVRRTLGSHPEIYVLNGPAPDEEVTYRELAITPVVNSRQQFMVLVDWLQEGQNLPRGYALHFDTAMNRLGLPAEDALSVAEACEGREPKLIMSHLACAEDAAAPLNETQRLLFTKVCEAFPGIASSLSNSGGVWLGGPYHQTLSRPGIGLYGGGVPPEAVTLKPGLTLEAPILQIHAAKTGETVGYGATWRAREPTLLATLAIGYGDGLPRSASNRGFVTLDGVRCPIVGRVSMDLITVDITAARDLARPGVFAQIIGDEAPLEEQAALAGTIGYELTTGLTARVERIYED